MNFFGLILSGVDLWLLGGAGALGMWWLNTYISPAIKRRQDAASAFRSAFDDVILNLRENPDLPIARIAFDCHPQHLAAIVKFRDYVPFWYVRGFDRAVRDYKEAHEIARDHGNVFAVSLSENTEAARAKRNYYHEAIKRVLFYA